MHYKIELLIVKEEELRDIDEIILELTDQEQILKLQQHKLDLINDIKRLKQHNLRTP